MRFGAICNGCLKVIDFVDGLDRGEVIGQWLLNGKSVRLLGAGEADDRCRCNRTQLVVDDRVTRMLLESEWCRMQATAAFVVKTACLAISMQQAMKFMPQVSDKNRPAALDVIRHFEKKIRLEYRSLFGTQLGGFA